MTRFYIVLFSVLFGLSSYCQVIIQGNVIDFNGQLLPSISISLVDPTNGAVITYTTSDANGNYSLSLQSDHTKVLLRTFSSKYDRYEQEIEAKSQLIPLVLEPKNTELEEIFIKASPIVQKNDTIVFDLNSFASKNDRVLQDVLKKMPGMEVSENGEIKYQGEKINEFLVEGKNLMQGSYSAITKALPNLHISKLEVYENHQPIKMLRGKIPSSSPAINIRLKNKISFSGSGRVAGGGDPFVYNVSASPMFFSKGLQYLVSLASNNSGEQPQQRFTNFSFGQAFDAFRMSTSSSPLLSIASLGNPSIDRKRYLRNKSNAVSANFLNDLSDQTTLNTNIFYNNEFVRQDALQSTSMAVFNPITNTFDPLIYTRENDNALFTESIQGKFTLTKNTDNNYIKNILTIDVDRKKDHSLMLLNQDPIDQELYSPNFNIQNSFSSLIPVGNKKFANFRSLVNFSNNKQNYLVQTFGNLNLGDPTLDSYQDLNQIYKQNKFYTHNAISMSWVKKKWTLTSEYSLQYEHTKFDTQLWAIDESIYFPMGAAYTNELTYNQIVNQLDNSASYSSNKWKMRFSLPISFRNIDLKDRQENTTQNKNKVNFLPSANITYTLNHMWTLRAGSNINVSYTPLSQLYSNFIFSGLNLSAYQGKTQDTRTWSNRGVVEFKNPFNGIFGNASITQSSTKNNVLLRQQIQPNGQQIIEAIEKDNTSTSLTSVVNIGKFFSDFSTNVKLTYSNQTTKNDVILNQSFARVTNHNNTYGVSFTNNHLSWLQVNYDFSYTQSSRDNHNTTVYSYKNSSLFSLDVSPFSSHSITYKLDYRQSNFNNQVFANRFMDLQYRYKWNKRKIDLELEWMNILNQKQYQQVIINDIQTTTSSYQIRPRQIVLRVRFTF